MEEVDEQMDYTVYKAKLTYDDLLERVDYTASSTNWSSFFMGLIVGVVNLVLVLVFFDDNNFMVELALLCQGHKYKLEAAASGEFVLVNIFQGFNALLFVLWGFASAYYLKRKKVSTVLMMRAAFIILSIVFLIIFFITGGLTTSNFNLNGKSPVNNYLRAYLPICVAILLIELVFMLRYYSALSSHIESMIDFHIFLNNYRQTPRSRNLKKY